MFLTAELRAKRRLGGHRWVVNLSNQRFWPNGEKLPSSMGLGARLIMCLHGSAFTLTESQPFPHPVHLTDIPGFPCRIDPNPSCRWILPYCWMCRIITPNQSSVVKGRGMFRSPCKRIFHVLHGCIIPTLTLEYSHSLICSSHHIPEYFHSSIRL